MNEQEAILKYIEEHGQITVAEAAAMVPPEIQSTAHYVLHRMAQEGLIVPVPAFGQNLQSFTYITLAEAQEIKEKDREIKICPCCHQEIDD